MWLKDCRTHKVLTFPWNDTPERQEKMCGNIVTNGCVYLSEPICHPLDIWKCILWWQPDKQKSRCKMCEVRMQACENGPEIQAVGDWSWRHSPLYRRWRRKVGFLIHQTLSKNKLRWTKLATLTTSQSAPCVPVRTKRSICVKTKSKDEPSNNIPFF